jgi:mannose-6-phosphate isomerase
MRDEESVKLEPHLVEKPWGRTDLPAFVPDAGGRRIGELWFEAPDKRALPLLVKYLFTSERLSVQVHPDDAAARARGLPHGKSECWYVVEAEHGARLALGFREEIGRERLRAAALDGSIEALLDWKPVRAGDVFSVPAGTVHAIGGGISLIEVQQPSDVTYRLYDFGRPRELHLDDALAVAAHGPYAPQPIQAAERSGVTTLVDGPHFSLLHIRAAARADELHDQDRFAIPLAGRVGEAGAGDCLWVPAGERLACSDDAVLLLAA